MTKEFFFRSATSEDALTAFSYGQRVRYKLGSELREPNRKRFNLDTFMKGSGFEVQEEIETLEFVPQADEITLFRDPDKNRFQLTIRCCKKTIYDGLDACCEIRSSKDELLFIGGVKIHGKWFNIYSDERPEWAGEALHVKLSRFNTYTHLGALGCPTK